MGVYEIQPCNIYAPSALRVISEMIIHWKRIINRLPGILSILNWLWAGSYLVNGWSAE